MLKSPFLSSSQASAMHTKQRSGKPEDSALRNDDVEKSDKSGPSGFFHQMRAFFTTKKMP